MTSCDDHAQRIFSWEKIVRLQTSKKISSATFPLFKAIVDYSGDSLEREKLS